MAKESNKKSFLDFFKMKDLDDSEFDDDLFDDDDDDDDEEEYIKPSRNKSKTSYNKNTSEKSQNTYNKSNSASSSSYSQSTTKPATQSSYSSGYNNYSSQRPQTRSSNSNKLVDFNTGRQQRSDSRGSGEVYVIKPQEISESQTVTDFLKNGKTIVINMEGLELAPAQRIIDFIGGACYALGGSLQAISANIFIAAPGSIEVSGDLREEILNESTVSPQLGRY